MMRKLLYVHAISSVYNHNIVNKSLENGEKFKCSEITATNQNYILKNLMQIEFRECLLSFSLEYFIFTHPIKKYE
jgi:hypothetical protein